MLKDERKLQQINLLQSTDDRKMKQINMLQSEDAKSSAICSLQMLMRPQSTIYSLKMQEEYKMLQP